jgi:intein/homing endonuclease
VNFKSLNWTEEKGLYYSKVKNIIRHKTSKKKFRIKAGNKEVIVTGDHSIIVFRNGEKFEVKPSEVKTGDKVLIYK